METDPLAVLSYEIQMYLGARHLQGLQIPQSAPHSEKLKIILESALVEVKALHIRILLEIFLERTKLENINIDDILPNWRKEHADIIQSLENAYNKIILKNGFTCKKCLNKFLAHPDKQRGDSFNWAPVIEIMDPPIKEALRTLPKNKFFPLWFFSKYLNN